MSSEARPSPIARHALLVIGVTTLIGVFSAAQIYVSNTALGRSVHWWEALYWGLGDWWEWALLWPVILWLARRFPFARGRWAASLAVHVLAGIVLAFGHVLMCAIADAPLAAWTRRTYQFTEAVQGLFRGRFQLNLAVYAFLVAGWNAWALYLHSRDREAHAARLAADLAQAQVQALRMQLNPHFLFNSLNAVSSLMLKDVKAANRMLVRLGELLRLTLDTSNQQEVPLHQELAFLQKLLDIEQIRFGDRLSVKFDIDSSTANAAVPTLLLQPLVENAIRHAIEPQIRTGRIELRAIRDNGHLMMEIADDGPGPPTSESLACSGVGLSNTRQRLRQLYGDDQQFDLAPRPGGGAVARIRIPLRLYSADASGTEPKAATK